MIEHDHIHKVTTLDQLGAVPESEQRRASIEENPFDWNNASIVAQDTKNG